MTNAADRKSVRRLEKAASLAQRNRDEVIADIMSTIAGRQWVYDLLTTCHCFQQPFTSDPLLTAFACGEMNIGQHLLADIMRCCPDQYILATREHHERSAAGERSDRANGNGGVEGSGGGVPDGYDPGIDGYHEDGGNGYDEAGAGNQTSR